MKRRISALQKNILTCFLLIGMVMSCIGFQIIYEIKNMPPGRDIGRATTQLSEGGKQTYDSEQIRAALRGFQHRVMAGLLIGGVGIGMIFLIIIKNVIKPLEEMAHVAEMMSQGRLDVTVPVRAGDEIGKIGRTVNDFAVNLQEILLHVWSHSSHAITFLEKIDKKILSCNCNCNLPELEDDVERVRHNIKEMQEMVRTFDYYDICLNDGKIRMKESSGEKI